MPSSTIAQQEAALPPPGAALPRGRDLVLLISMGIFVSSFAQDQVLALFPLRHALKNGMHASATATSTFFLIVGLAWYAKPLFGVLTDAFPLFGTRRRSYLLLGAVSATLLWAGYAFTPVRYAPYVLMMSLVNTALVLVSTVSGGLLVEEGQRSAATGKLSSVRNVMTCVAAVIAGPVGAFLVARRFVWTAAAGGLLCAALVAVALHALPEARAPRRGMDRSVLAGAGQQLGRALRSRALLLAALFTFLVTFAPGFQTPLYYYQTNTLHFTDGFISGHLVVFNNVFGVLGSLAYALICRRFALRTMIVASIALSAAAALGYLRYHTAAQAMVVESVYGFAINFVTVMTLDIAAIATPPGCEAMAYALLMSAYNIASKGADVVGSVLHDAAHIPFPHLVWINSATTLLTLAALPLLPRHILAHRDSAPTAPPAEAGTASEAPDDSRPPRPSAADPGAPSERGGAASDDLGRGVQ